MLGHGTSTESLRHMRHVSSGSSPGGSFQKSGSWGLDNYYIDPKTLHLEGRIGVGCQGVVVYKATKGGVAPVAVKIIPKAGMEDDIAIKKEVEAMVRIKGPNVLQLYGVAQDDHSYMLVMELCERGSLMDLLKQARQSPWAAKLTWATRLEIAQQIAMGMALIHAESVLHRDLKSPNVLLTNKMDVKVADFGFSRIVPDSIEQYASLTTPMNLRWLAPEIAQPDPDMTKMRWSQAADIYSFGVILWELMTFQFPFAEQDNLQLLVKMTRDGCLRLPIPQQEDIPGGPFVGIDEYLKLMQECLCQQPHERPQNFRNILDRLKDIYRNLRRGTTTISSEPHGNGVPYSSFTQTPTTPEEGGGHHPAAEDRYSPWHAPQHMQPVVNSIPKVERPVSLAPLTGGEMGATGTPATPRTADMQQALNVGNTINGQPARLVTPGPGSFHSAASFDEPGSATPHVSELARIADELPDNFKKATVLSRCYHKDISKFISWFNSIDKNQNGDIDHGELSDAVHRTPVVNTQGDQERAAFIMKLVEEFRDADVNMDGQIDLAEFLMVAGRALREEEELSGRQFDLQQYEQDCKELLAKETQPRSISVDDTGALVYRSIFTEYAQWFRELDTSQSGALTLTNIKAFLDSCQQDAQKAKSEKHDMFEQVARKFDKFDHNRDGRLDKHEYMHMCAKLVTEAQAREGYDTFNEKHCRYMLYFFAMEQPDKPSWVAYSKMQHNRLAVLGVKGDPSNYYAEALAEVAKELKGGVVTDDTLFSCREFKEAFDALETRRLERLKSSAFGVNLNHH